MLDKLKKLCNKLYNEATKDEDINKYLLISKILEDENCFFKMSIEDSVNILKDLGFNEKEAIDLYEELVNSNYYS